MIAHFSALKVDRIPALFRGRQFEQADSSLGCLLFEMASAFPEMILFNRKGKFLALLKKKSMGK